MRRKGVREGEEEEDRVEDWKRQMKGEEKMKVEKGQKEEE